MGNGIKEKDIQDFKNYAQKLDELIKRIREYCPGAYIFATPFELNLMTADDMFVAGSHLDFLEAGDW